MSADQNTTAIVPSGHNEPAVPLCDPVQPALPGLGRAVAVHCVFCFSTAIGETPREAHRLMEAHYREDHR